MMLFPNMSPFSHPFTNITHHLKESHLEIIPGAAAADDMACGGGSEM